jgi:hypothetical protein
MDQLKELLRQAIKYRFWISVSLAALLSLIAYFSGSGTIQDEAKKETQKIESADKDVKLYSQGVPYNGDYKPVLEEKKAEVVSDVNKSWKKLYKRQAPLLTWPNDLIQQKFQTWGKAWPADVDGSKVQVAIIEYVESYEPFVELVYKTCKPYDYETGKGVVAMPPMEELLHPAKFSRTDPPNDLAKVWAAQARLWVQRSLLQVVADVNRGAKDWDGAVIKQIFAMEVGTPLAQDQVSMADGEKLKQADPIVDPKAPAPPADASAGSPAAEMGSMGGGMGGGGTLGRSGASDSVFYITTTSTQFQVLPVQMTVLVPQDRVQDFLVALENSPLAIQVKEMELQRPNQRVTKPKQGEMGMGGYGAGMMGMMMGRQQGQMGFGGSMSSAMSQMMAQGQMSASRSGMGGMMGGAYGRSATPARKGVEKRGTDARKEREEASKAALSKTHESLQDPYYNIVEVSIFGQARFYNPPPAEAPVEPSQSANDATASANENAPPVAADATKSAPTEVPGAAKVIAADADNAADPSKPTSPADAVKKDAAAKPEQPIKDAATPAAADPSKPADAPKAAVETPKEAAPKAAVETPKEAAPKAAVETPKQPAEPAKAAPAGTPKK